MTGKLRFRRMRLRRWIKVPLYEYRCTHCGHHFERIQPVGAPPEPCPACGAPSRKAYGPVGLVFRGSGFYRTDYGRSSGGNGASRSEPEEKGERKSESASTGSEPGR